MLFSSSWGNGRPHRINNFEADHVGLDCNDGTKVRTGRDVGPLPELGSLHVDRDRRFNGRLEVMTKHKLVRAKLKGGFHSDRNSAFGSVHYQVTYYGHKSDPIATCRSKDIGWEAHR